MKQYIKKDRPVEGTTGQSVQGLASKNNHKYMIAHFRQNASPKFFPGGEVTLP